MCFRLSSFCCCCSLRASAITAAVFTLLSAIAFLAVAVQMFWVADWLESTDPKSGNSVIGRFLASATKAYKADGDIKNIQANWESSKENREAGAQICKIVGGVVAGLAAAVFLIFICLCCALSKKNACLLLPWLIYNMIVIILYTACAIFVVVTGALAALPVFVVNVAFSLYLWMGVYSYYKELDNPTSVHPNLVEKY